MKGSLLECENRTGVYFHNLLTFFDSIVHIPANDAAVHRQTAMMQLAQEMDSNAAISTFKPLPTVTR